MTQKAKTTALSTYKTVLLGLPLMAALLFTWVPAAHAVPFGPDGGPSNPGGNSTVGPTTTSDAAVCEGSGGTWNGSECIRSGDNRTVPGVIQQVATVLIFIVGAVAVLMGVIGGLRYTLAQGDSNATAAAKNTVIYAVVGVVVAVAAYAIVNFVTTNIG